MTDESSKQTRLSFEALRRRLPRMWLYLFVIGFGVVMVLPFFFRTFGDLGTTVRTFASGDAGAIGANDMMILASCAVVGFYAARFLRIPAPHITGPMIFSAAVHLAGLTSA